MCELVREITRCRACGSDRLDVVLDLGTHCISDFVDDGGEPDRAPLTLVRCADCTLVQLHHTVDRDRLYRGTYWYHSGTNESMRSALADVVREACMRVELRTGDAVIDIGCNDGTLLDCYPAGTLTVGFDPAPNVAEEARAKRHVVWPKYWSWEAFSQPMAKIITSIACFYSVEDSNRFVADIKRALLPDGVWVCQMMDLHQMVAKTAFDNICHEHLAYWSYASFSGLVERYALEVVDMSANDTNGGSIRYIVKHRTGLPRHTPLASVEHSAADINAFAKRVSWLRNDTLRMLEHLPGLCWGYGASTKGNTLLQYYGIGPEHIFAIADRNPDKWGKRTVGTNIPIVSEADWRQANPPYTLVLPWHFLEAFKFREADYLRGGGTFILPLPKLREVTCADLQPTPAPTIIGAGLAT